LIRDFLEKNSFVPDVCYFVLAESAKNINKLKFVKFDEGAVEINDDDDGDESDDDFLKWLYKANNP